MRRRAGLPAALLALLAAAPPSRADEAVERLAAAIRHRTISHQDAGQFDPEAFLAFHEFLRRSFPGAHRSLEREVVNGYSLLYTWEGRDPARAPILLASHFDVVPVPEGQAAEWQHPPFAGAIADGYVWGRGAIDDKVGVMAMLEAVERLAGEGVQPAGRVYLAFGHDEERGGPEGAGAITALLRERGVSLEYTLDEGLAIVAGGVAGIERPVALIGIAEKGYLTLEIVARGPGGHSSTPPPSGAIGRLADAIQAVEANPLPGRIEGASAAMFDALAPHLEQPASFLVDQRWLFEPLLVRFLAGDPATNAMIRTTTAVTMVNGGTKENVLPPQARATVNFRIVPGDDADGVVAHVREVIGDPEVAIEVVRTREPSQVADVESASYRRLAQLIERLHPGAIVAPALVVGGTDTKHYGALAENSYRFTPMTLGPDDLTRIHGKDERLSVEDYGRVVGFYAELLRGS